MPVFNPPTEPQSSDDSLFGRFTGARAGLSVMKVNGHYITQPFPWLGEIADLTEGVDWFQGGRVYLVSSDVGDALVADGYTLNTTDQPYGKGLYGGYNYGG